MGIGANNGYTVERTNEGVRRKRDKGNTGNENWATDGSTTDVCKTRAIFALHIKSTNILGAVYNKENIEREEMREISGRVGPLTSGSRPLAGLALGGAKAIIGIPRPAGCIPVENDRVASQLHDEAAPIYIVRACL